MSISVIDLCVIVVYLLGIVYIGLRASGHFMKQSSDDYFLASHSLGWGVIGTALFAANISTIHIVGFAESGFTTGLLDGIFEWMAIPCLIFLGIFITPFYYRERVTTIPGYIENRFNGTARTFMVIFAIFTALLIHIGISLYAGAAIVQQFFSINVNTAIIIISIITGIYAILGGLKAVAITESIQTVLLIAGSTTITFAALFMLPEAGIHSFAEFRDHLKPDQLSMLRSSESVGKNGIPWYAVLLGYPVMGIWYFFADQTIVQRVLGARTERDARLGPLFTAVLKFAPVLFMLLPGVLAYVLFKDEIMGQAAQTFPILIKKLLPVGVQGLVIASLLAALMSTIAAALNSSATLVSLDILKRYKPQVTDKTMVKVGRATALVVMILAIIWSTQAYRFGEGIIHTVNSIGAMIAPSISAVFMLGFFWKRGTQQAAVMTFSLGLLLGVLQFLLDIPIIGDTRLISEMLGVGFMMQTFWVFCSCCIIFVVTSYATPEPSAEQVNQTFDYKRFSQSAFKGITDLRVVGFGIFLLLVVLWTTLELIA